MLRYLFRCCKGTKYLKNWIRGQTVVPLENIYHKKKLFVFLNEERILVSGSGQNGKFTLPQLIWFGPILKFIQRCIARIMFFCTFKIASKINFYKIVIPCIKVNYPWKFVTWYSVVISRRSLLSLVREAEADGMLEAASRTINCTLATWTK